jgi:hypothetical protein
MTHKNSIRNRRFGVILIKNGPKSYTCGSCTLIKHGELINQQPIFDQHMMN